MQQGGSGPVGAGGSGRGLVPFPLLAGVLSSVGGRGVLDRAAAVGLLELAQPVVVLAQDRFPFGGGLVDRDKQEENRKVAITTCRGIRGDYANSALQCDEYPFSSTYEGANQKDSAGKPVNRYSARLIDGKDNGDGTT
ncbi:hypothetical protein ACGF0D_39395 [Kitasatospora sp. NPDC048298]|uniref:NucA/NucB deoxyribonuclease domain-containing protein n=1 Tax=Kitasatospora sp. NPDC048298 TaxID=3364049 RepID=UPI00371A0599